MISYVPIKALEGNLIASHTNGYLTCYTVF